MNHSRLLVSHRTWTAVWYPSPERCSSRMQQLWFVHLMALHFWLVLQCRGLISVASPVKKKQKNNMYLAIAFPPWPAGCCSSGVILLLWSWSLPPECLWTRESRHDSCMKGTPPWEALLRPSPASKLSLHGGTVLPVEAQLVHSAKPRNSAECVYWGTALLPPPATQTCQCTCTNAQGAGYLHMSRCRLFLFLILLHLTSPFAASASDSQLKQTFTFD